MRSPSKIEPMSVGFVYVIRGEHNLIKVGSSTNPRARLAQLRTASPYPLQVEHLFFARADLYVRIERTAHKILDNHRINLEWFDCAPDVAVAAIHAAAEQLGDSVSETNIDSVHEVLKSEITNGNMTPDQKQKQPPIPWYVAVLVSILYPFVAWHTWGYLEEYFGSGFFKRILTFPLALFLAIPIYAIIIAICAAIWEWLTKEHKT